jgi:hypothetical protein
LPLSRTARFWTGGRGNGLPLAQDTFFPEKRNLGGKHIGEIAEGSLKAERGAIFYPVLFLSFPRFAWECPPTFRVAANAPRIKSCPSLHTQPTVTMVNKVSSFQLARPARRSLSHPKIGLMWYQVRNIDLVICYETDKNIVAGKKNGNLT